MQNYLYQKTNIIGKNLFLFLFGGIVYYLIEILWRGHSHYSMMILGGLCFFIIGSLNESKLLNGIGLLYQMIISSGIITILEFMFGLILNVYLKMNIWDYSNLPFNIMGQICLPFTIAWFGLSLVAIIADDFIRYKFFGEELPKYKII